MSSADIEEEIRTHLPGTEEIIVQYLSGYLVDDAGEDEDVLGVARTILGSVAQRDAGNDSSSENPQLEKLMASLQDLLADMLQAREKNKARPTLTKLDKVVDMSKSGVMSSTIAFTEGVDLESINKGK
jgi:ATP-binding cassette, subfamily F, member 3